MQSLQFKSQVDFFLHSDLSCPWMVEITGGNTGVISTCCSPSAPSPAEWAALLPLGQRLLVIKMLRLTSALFYNLDVAYTLRKVFEGRLAGLGKVHICSASLLVFNTSQTLHHPGSWRKRSERRQAWGRGREKGRERGREAGQLSPNNAKLVSDANLGILNMSEFPGSSLEFWNLALFSLHFWCVCVCFSFAWEPA